MPNLMIGDPTGNYFAVMQSDCNFVLYASSYFCSSNALWTSGTAGRGSGCYLAMQNDNNLIMYDNTGKVVWQTNTGGKGKAGGALRINQDGNMMIYDSMARWFGEPVRVVLRPMSVRALTELPITA